jgi:hypothetical protein
MMPRHCFYMACVAAVKDLGKMSADLQAYAVLLRACACHACHVTWYNMQLCVPQGACCAALKAQRVHRLQAACEGGAARTRPCVRLAARSGAGHVQHSHKLGRTAATHRSGTCQCNQNSLNLSLLSKPVGKYVM